MGEVVSAILIRVVAPAAVTKLLALSRRYQAAGKVNEYKAVTRRVCFKIRRDIY